MFVNVYFFFLDGFRRFYFISVILLRYFVKYCLYMFIVIVYKGYCLIVNLDSVWLLNVFILKIVLIYMYKDI